LDDGGVDLILTVNIATETALAGIVNVDLTFGSYSKVLLIVELQQCRCGERDDVSLHLLILKMDLVDLVCTLLIEEAPATGEKPQHEHSIVDIVGEACGYPRFLLQLALLG
jgi:hypothetical protein